MANAADFPNPNGPKPAGVSDSAWYGYTQVDSSKPLAQWTAWDQYYDPSQTGYARYKSDKVDANGNPIQGSFEHPDACPEGTTAVGLNKCLPLDQANQIVAQQAAQKAPTAPSPVQTQLQNQIQSGNVVPDNSAWWHTGIGESPINLNGAMDGLQAPIFKAPPMPSVASTPSTGAAPTPSTAPGPTSAPVFTPPVTSPAGQINPITQGPKVDPTYHTLPAGGTQPIPGSGQTQSPLLGQLTQYRRQGGFAPLYPNSSY